jgi:hypothetical protein
MMREQQIEKVFPIKKDLRYRTAGKSLINEANESSEDSNPTACLVIE